jgi:hypothetical protein
MTSALAVLCAACGEMGVLKDLAKAQGSLTRRYRAQTTLNLTNGVLTVMFQNSQYDSLAAASRAGFAWDVARFAYAQLPPRDSITAVDVGFSRVRGGMGLTFSRTEVPYGWSADVLRAGR